MNLRSKITIRETRRVTNDHHFNPVPELKYENWVAEGEQ